MSKLNRLGISILIGYLLINSLNSNDFETLKKLLNQKIKSISPPLSDSVIELYQLVTDNFHELSTKDHHKNIDAKITEVKNQLTSIKEEQIADLIIHKLKNKG